MGEARALQRSGNMPTIVKSTALFLVPIPWDPGVPCTTTNTTSPREGKPEGRAGKTRAGSSLGHSLQWLHRGYPPPGLQPTGCAPSNPTLVPSRPSQLYSKSLWPHPPAMNRNSITEWENTQPTTKASSSTKASSTDLRRAWFPVGQTSGPRYLNWATPYLLSLGLV